VNLGDALAWLGIAHGDVQVRAIAKSVVAHRLISGAEKGFHGAMSNTALGARIAAPNAFDNKSFPAHFFALRFLSAASLA
jgi:hypothetical protein